MNDNDLHALFAKEPASFVWTTAIADESRTIGTAPSGAVLDLAGTRATLTAIFPPDCTDLAAHNAMLFLLLLTALRPDWTGAASWLTHVMRFRAADVPLLSRRVRFQWQPEHSRAILTVERP